MSRPGRVAPATIATLFATLAAGLVAGLALALSGCGGGSNPVPAPSPPPPTPSAVRPTLTSVQPTTVAPGAALTLRGHDFDPDETLDTVTIGGRAAQVLFSSTSELVCATPNGLAGAQPVVVTTPAGTTSAVTVQVSGSAAGRPSIHSLTPAAAAPGVTLVVRGQGFSSQASANQVWIDGLAARVVQAAGTRLDVEVPARAQTGAVSVSTAQGTSNPATLFVTSDLWRAPRVLGAAAGELLTTSPYTELVVEVDYVQGKAPDADALFLLARRINERCRKPGGVRVVLSDQMASPGISSWSSADLRALEPTYRDHYTRGTTETFYVIYVDQGWVGDQGTLRTVGVAYAATALGMLKDNLLAVGGPDRERHTLVHELGHLLGLVNLGTPMQTPHEDSQNSGHDQSTGCVMYWKGGAGAPTVFDTPCRDDLRAVGGR